MCSVWLCLEGDVCSVWLCLEDGVAWCVWLYLEGGVVCSAQGDL